MMDPLDKDLSQKADKSKEKKETGPLINERIRAPKLQLITHEGQNIGEIGRNEALRMARDANLDLVIIAESGKDGIPVAKIMDYGKSLYEKKKKEADAKKRQVVVQIKEIKMRPTIGVHDYQTKMDQAIRFLKDGNRLKVTLMFKGREVVTKAERGAELFDRIDKTFEDQGLLKDLISEKDMNMGQLWSRFYVLKKSH